MTVAVATWSLLATCGLVSPAATWRGDVEFGGGERIPSDGGPATFAAPALCVRDDRLERVWRRPGRNRDVLECGVSRGPAESVSDPIPLGERAGFESCGPHWVVRVICEYREEFDRIDLRQNESVLRGPGQGVVSMFDREFQFREDKASLDGWEREALSVRVAYHHVRACGDSLGLTGRDQSREQHGFDVQTVDVDRELLGSQLADVDPRTIADDAPQPGSGVEYFPDAGEPDAVGEVDPLARYLNHSAGQRLEEFTEAGHHDAFLLRFVLGELACFAEPVRSAVELTAQNRRVAFDQRDSRHSHRVLDVRGCFVDAAGHDQELRGQHRGVEPGECGIGERRSFVERLECGEELVAESFVEHALQQRHQFESCQGGLIVVCSGDFGRGFDERPEPVRQCGVAHYRCGARDCPIPRRWRIGGESFDGVEAIVDAVGDALTA